MLKKINSVRKHKGVILPYELIWENGRKLSNFGRITEECSSVLWKRVLITSEKPSKGSKKVWGDFTRWLRNQNIKTIKDFQEECEWKLLVNNHSERFHIKENNDMHTIWKKVREINVQNKCEHEKEYEEMEAQSEGVIWLFVNYELRIIDKKL